MSASTEPNRSSIDGEAAPEPTGRDCFEALRHADRRRILRALHEAGEARSPKEVSEALDARLSLFSHHFRVLKKCCVVVLTDTQPRRGSIEHFYISTVMDNELVGRLLELTRAEDDRAAGE